MKPHEHIIISAVYAVGVAAIAGQGFDDPGIYLASILGGEILDLIDHPLYHLVYRRNEENVVEARKILAKDGLRATISYLIKMEDERKFVGLLLHNVISLSIAALIGIIAVFFIRSPIYGFIFLGAILLHMICDMYGDFKILGNYDNWLWVLPDKLLRVWGKRSRKLVLFVTSWLAFVLLSFFLVSFRWAELHTGSRH